MTTSGMKRKIGLPEGFSAAVQGQVVTLSHQGKQASKNLGDDKVDVSIEGNNVVLHTAKSSRRENAVLNTLQSHVQNLVHGLQKPFKYKLAVVFSHFPMTIAVKGEWVEINNFVGEKKPRKARILPNTQVEIKGKDVFVTSTSKENAGQTAANLENATRVMGKDRRVYQDGIFIVGLEIARKG